jgi:hypothetical protein
MAYADMMSAGSAYPDLPDPSDQKKVEDILETVGLHPAQLHVQGVLTGDTPQSGSTVLPGGVVASPKPAGQLIAAPAAAPAPAVQAPRIPSPLSPAAPPGLSVGSGAPLVRAPQEQNAIDSTTGAQNELARLNRTGSGISQIKNPFLRTLARVGDIAGTALFPSIVQNIPGTELHHDLLEVQQEHKIGEGLGQQKELAQTAEDQARTEAVSHPKPQLEMTDQGLVRVPQEGEAAPVTMGGTALKKPEAEIKPVLQETDQGLVSVDPKTNVATAVTLGGQPLAKAGGKPLSKDQADALNGVWGRIAVANHLPQNPFQEGMSADDAKTLRESLQSAINATQREVRIEMPKAEAGTWSVQEGPGGKTVLFNNKTGETKDAPADLVKPTADEKRRSDLGNNLLENLNNLEDIVKRRPDLFGPVSGRVTQAKEAIGTDDPDVAALKTLSEQAGMAMVGAHAMRNAQHVQTAAEAITNAYKNSPKAVLNSIEKARQSIGTFMNDANGQRGNEASPAAGGGTTHFVEGEDHWDIPADKVAAFKKAHPNAKAQ